MAFYLTAVSSFVLWQWCAKNGLNFIYRSWFRAFIRGNSYHYRVCRTKNGIVLSYQVSQEKVMVLSNQLSAQKLMKQPNFVFVKLKMIGFSPYFKMAQKLVAST